MYGKSRLLFQPQSPVSETEPTLDSPREEPNPLEPELPSFALLEMHLRRRIRQSGTARQNVGKCDINWEFLREL
ncbi:hypothetical protein ACTXT7_006912 [Hymenolepis weldensis]